MGLDAASAAALALDFLVGAVDLAGALAGQVADFLGARSRPGRDGIRTSGDDTPARSPRRWPMHRRPASHRDPGWPAAAKPAIRACRRTGPCRKDGRAPGRAGSMAAPQQRASRAAARSVCLFQASCGCDASGCACERHCAGRVVHGPATCGRASAVERSCEPLAILPADPRGPPGTMVPRRPDSGSLVATTLHTSNLPGLALLHRGKVRDVFGLDDRRLLMVATDRLSAFDVVLPDPIPGKGEMLCQISQFLVRQDRAPDPQPPDRHRRRQRCCRPAWTPRCTRSARW